MKLAKRLAILLVVLAVLTTAGCSKRVKKDDVMMTIGGYDVLAAEYISAVLTERDRAFGNAKDNKLSSDEWNGVVEDVRNELIDKYTMYDWALEQGCKLCPDDYEDVGEELDEYTQNGEDYLRLLHLNEELLSQSLLTEKLLDDFVTQIRDMSEPVGIDDDELSTYCANIGVYSYKSIAFPKECSDAASAVLDRVLSGEDFDALAVDYSSDGNAFVYPDGRCFKSGEISKEIEDAVLEVMPGEVFNGLVSDGDMLIIVKRVEPRDEQYRLAALSEKIADTLSKRRVTIRVEISEKCETLSQEKASAFEF